MICLLSDKVIYARMTGQDKWVSRRKCGIHSQKFVKKTYKKEQFVRPRFKWGTIIKYSNTEQDVKYTKLN